MTLVIPYKVPQPSLSFVIFDVIRISLIRNDVKITNGNDGWGTLYGIVAKNRTAPCNGTSKKHTDMQILILSVSRFLCSRLHRG